MLVLVPSCTGLDDSGDWVQMLESASLLLMPPSTPVSLNCGLDKTSLVSCLNMVLGSMHNLTGSASMLATVSGSGTGEDRPAWWDWMEVMVSCSLLVWADRRPAYRVVTLSCTI